MRHPPSRRRSVVVAPLLVAGALALAGCSGSAAVSAAAGSSAPAATTGASATATAAASAGTTTEPSSPAPTPTPSSYRGPVLAIGDSVMLGAQPCLAKVGVTVDAAESRSFGAGHRILTAALAKGTVPDAVVLHLGTNGPFSVDSFDAVMQEVGPERQVYWVNVHLPAVERYAYAAEDNAVIAERVPLWPNAHLVDWDAAAKANPQWLYKDKTHLTEEGCTAFAQLVDDAVRAPRTAS